MVKHSRLNCKQKESTTVMRVATSDRAVHTHACHHLRDTIQHSRDNSGGQHETTKSTVYPHNCSKLRAHREWGPRDEAPPKAGDRLMHLWSIRCNFSDSI